MELPRIAWRNIGRNRRRSLLTGLAVAFACTVLMFSMGLQRGSYASMIYNTVHAHTGHLQVQHPDYWPDQDIVDALRDAELVLETARATPHVQGAAPRLSAAALLSRGDRTLGAALFGIRPDAEARVSTLDATIVDGAYLDANDREGVLVGKLLAANLELSVGDELVFLGQGADGSLAAGRLFVRGLFEKGTGEMDRTTAFARLDALQEAFAMRGGVTEIAVLLDDDRYRESTARDLERTLRDQGITNTAIVGWPTLLPGVEQGIRLDWTSGLVIYAVLALVVGFGIANTFLMAYMERIHEFGVLRALGMQPVRIGAMVYLESVLLSLLGVAGGLLAGSGIVLILNRTGINFGMSEDVMASYGLDPVIYPRLEPVVFEWAVVIVLTIALAVAVYPAIKAGRIKPVEALRG